MKQWSGETLGYRGGNGPADQVHVANEIDAFLVLIFELKHEAKYIARVDQADDDHIARIRNLVIEDDFTDARPDELSRRAFGGAAGKLGLPGSP